MLFGRNEHRFGCFFGDGIACMGLYKEDDRHESSNPSNSLIIKPDGALLRLSLR